MFSYRRISLVLVEKETAQISLIFDKEGWAFDDGSHHVFDVYTSLKRDNWKAKYRATTTYPEIEPDKKYEGPKYIYIEEEEADSVWDEDGYLVENEYGDAQSKIIFKKGIWYEIIGNQLKKVEEIMQ